MQQTYFRDHSYTTSAKDWVGGSRKLPVLLTFSIIYADVGWVGESEKVQIFADVI